MPYNPQRAKNFYKNTTKRVRRRPHKNQITKHSDLVRRQGIGTSVAMSVGDRVDTGYADSVFSGKDFEVSGEVLMEGNATPFGFNPEGDRVYYVTKGILYVTIQQGKTKEILKFAEGSVFNAVRSMKYSVASSNSSVEMVVVSSSNYDENFEVLEEGTTSHFADVVLSTEVARKQMLAKSERTGDLSKAKKAAAKLASRKNKGKKRGGTVHGKTSLKAGKTTNNDNANAASAVGVNPKPGGPGAFRD